MDEPVAMRYDFDGYGYLYIDSGSGSDWQTRIKNAEPLYTAPKELSDEEMNEIIQFLNQSRISWSGNEFIKEAMRLAIKKASEK